MNKVIYGTTVLVDLTADTVTADQLVKGVTAHNKSGAQVTGTLETASIYTGTSEPASSFGSDGDLFFVIES